MLTTLISGESPTVCNYHSDDVTIQGLISGTTIDVNECDGVLSPIQHLNILTLLEGQGIVMNQRMIICNSFLSK